MNPVRPRQAGSAFAAIALMLKQAGGVEQVANFTGRHESTVYKWTDPDQTDGTPFSTLCLISEHFRATAAAEHLALRAGGVFVPLPEFGNDEELASVTAQSAAAFAEVMHETAKALDPKSEAGRQISPREAARMVTEIDEAISALAGLRGLARTIAERG